MRKNCSSVDYLCGGENWLWIDIIFLSHLLWTNLFSLWAMSALLQLCFRYLGAPCTISLSKVIQFQPHLLFFKANFVLSWLQRSVVAFPPFIFSRPGFIRHFKSRTEWIFFPLVWWYCHVFSLIFSFLFFFFSTTIKKINCTLPPPPFDFTFDASPFLRWSSLCLEPGLGLPRELWCQFMHQNVSKWVILPLGMCSCWPKEHPSSLPKALLIIDSRERCGGVYINKDLSYLQPRMT